MLQKRIYAWNEYILVKRVYGCEKLVNGLHWQTILQSIHKHRLIFNSLYNKPPWLHRKQLCLMIQRLVLNTMRGRTRDILIILWTEVPCIGALYRELTRKIKISHSSPSLSASLPLHYVLYIVLKRTLKYRNRNPVPNPRAHVIAAVLYKTQHNKKENSPQY